MKNSILIFVILFIFSGCGLKQENLSINYYSIDFQTKSMLEKSKFNSIFIEEPNVNNAFNLKSIFYSTKDYKLEEYSKNRWINTPSNMIYAQVIDSFNSSNIFNTVVTKDKRIKTDYLLKTEVIKFYQVFEEGKSYAILKINFDLVKDNMIIKSFNYDKKILCKTNDAYGFVVATNEGVEESINILLRDLLAF